MTTDQMRRLEAKRANERTKLAATLANNLAVGALIGGILSPTLAGHAESIDLALALFAIAAALHFYGQYLLRDLMSEE